MDELIDKLKKMQKINDSLQEQTPEGGTRWHNHETIDDLIHDILTELGD